jgi:ABC-type branched-subunit amino acid transport system ATPase component
MTVNNTAANNTAEKSTTPNGSAQPVIECDDLTMRFGGVVALDDVSVRVPAGIAAVIGPNGAGKTTLFNVWTGNVRGYDGHVRAFGSDISGWKPHRVARLGVVRTFQHPLLFESMTCQENVAVGLHHSDRFRPITELLGLRELRHGPALTRRAAELLDMVGLADAAAQEARFLPYGEKRLLEIARALAAGPRALLLDEPAAGLNPDEVHRLADLLRGLAADGLSIVLIEHNVPFVAAIAAHVTVLADGRTLCSGTPRDVLRNPQVQEAYLGRSERVITGEL